MATLLVVQLVVQVVLAAAFVSGETDLFQVHSLNGSLMNTFPLLMVLTAALHATVARGARWPVAATTGLLLLCTVQEVLGYTRVVGAHIVGGSLVLCAAVLLCVALWRSRYRPRPRRRERRQPVATPPTGVPAEPPTEIPAAPTTVSGGVR